jgi:hypothetical protein
MPTFELVEKEDARGVIAGSDYGSRVRIMARSPTHVIFNGLGSNYWDRNEHSGWHGLKHLFHGRPTIAQFEAVADKINEVLGEGAAPWVVRAWREKKTLWVDGGGEALPLPNIVQHRLRYERYVDATADFKVDLTGRVKTCLQCGENLRPKTNHHRMGYDIQENHPRSIEDCQRMSNQAVIAVHSYGMNREDRWGLVEWFETWDGESLQDPYFCDSKCAAKFGRRAAEAAVVLEPGVEPVEIPYVPRDDVQHYDPGPPRFIEGPNGKIRIS